MTYTHGHHDTVLRSHRWRTAENSVAYLFPHLHAGQSLLDVGCGPGTITADLAALVAPGPVTAVDRSGDVLAEASRVAADRGVPVTFAVADVEALTYPDGAFDVVHAHQVLHHVDDPVRALSEMRRVCAPDGVVAVRETDYGAMTWYPRLPELDDWRALYQTIARRNGDEPDAGRHLLAWAHAAGFTDVTATATAWCFASPEDREFWGGMWAERIITSAIATQALVDGDATAGDLARLAAGWRRWVVDPDGWFAVLHGEVICRR